MKVSTVLDSGMQVIVNFGEELLSGMLILLVFVRIMVRIVEVKSFRSSKCCESVAKFFLFSLNYFLMALL